jgi:hypothetical protein
MDSRPDETPPEYNFDRIFDEVMEEMFGPADPDAKPITKEEFAKLIDSVAFQYQLRGLVSPL